MRSFSRSDSLSVQDDKSYMCLAIPGQVVEISGRKATVKYPSVTNFALIGEDDVRVGDWVMVQMGIVIKKLEKKEALGAQEAWK